MKQEGLIQPHWHQSPKQGYNESEKLQVPTKISSSSTHQSQQEPDPIPIPIPIPELLRGQYKNSSSALDDHIKPKDYQSPTSSTFQTHQSPQAPPLSSLPLQHQSSHQTLKQSYEDEISVQQEIPSRIRIPHHHQVPDRKQTQFSEHYVQPKHQFPEQISSQAHGKQILEENQSLSISSLQPQFPKQDSSWAPQPERKQSYGDSKSAPQPPKQIHEHPQNQKSEPDGFKDGFKESIDAAAPRKVVQLETDVSPKKGTNYSYEVESWIPELDDIEAALAEAEQEQQQKSQNRPFAACAKLKLCRKQIQRSCSYVFHYKRYVKQLEHGMEMVREIRAALRIEVAIAQSQKKSVSPVVVNWIAGMDKIEPETRRFIGESKGRKHYLCWPMARYSLSCKCVKKREQLREIERQGRLFRKVADPAVPPPRIGSTSVRILMPDFSRLG
ncbi:hypothetical protein COLO4_12080 [Corchorus olitorius]|uniref:Uncharacterized protein n=1 Tax=Corchorus olitorius TaxID=93759 RepID=A0A1R3K260_9ROSI|nr:hypothetical protein COLO4_12080 [Corchorus olitorius]